MSFAAMVKKYGDLMALDMLMAIEKMANIPHDEVLLALTHEQRLAQARAALDRIDEERKAAVEKDELPHTAEKKRTS